MVSFNQRISAIILSLSVTACSTLTVSTDYNPDFDFSSLQTYGWLDVEDARIEGARVDNPLIRNRIISSVDTALQSKGFVKSTEGTPDFLVTWLGAVDTRLRYDTISNFYGPYWSRGYYGGGWSGYQRTYATEYEEGTLIIDILSQQDKQLVWRGTGRDFVDNLRTQEEITKMIDNAVNRILADFPPGRKPE